MDTRERYAAYADRIAPVSPTYAAWARSVDDDVVAVLDEVRPTKRQPELVFAVARRLGADPHDPAALRALCREARPAMVAALASATTQANDPRRLAPVVPLFAALSESSREPLGLLEVGASAGLCSIPDRVTLDYVVGRAPSGAAHSGAAERDVPGTVRRMHDAVAEPSIHLEATASGAVPPPANGPIRIGARVGLDPNPIDLGEPSAFDRLVEAVPPEATDRTALMREAARATLAGPPGMVRGTVPGDLDRALGHLPDGCTPVVMTAGTLVYVPGADRQRFVDRIRELGVRWVAMERTGVLSGVAATLPEDVDAAHPDAFATVSLDGVAVAVADAYGTVVRWLRDPGDPSNP